MRNYVNLPAAQIPANALIDMSGAYNALETLRQQNNIVTERQREDEQQRYQRGRAAKADARADDVYNLDREKRVAQHVAGLAQMIDIEQDPIKRQQMFGKLIGSDPRFSQQFTKYGIDPNDHINGPKFLIAQAQGYQDPMERRLKEAQIKSTEALATQRAMGPEQDTTADVKNYQFSQGQGFKGTFDEWRRQNKPDGVPNALQTEAARASQAYDTLSAELDDFERLVAGTVGGAPQVDDKGRRMSGTGLTYWPGAEKDMVDQKRRNIQLQMKELYNLGVLNGPDLALMDQMLFDPSSLSAMVGDTGKRVQANVANVKDMMKRLRDDKVRTFSSPLKDQRGGPPGVPQAVGDDGWQTINGVRIREKQ